MSFYPLRKIEVWVDGAKRSETYNNFGLEAWSDVNIPLTVGSHTATVIAANYDNRLIKKSVTFTVGRSTCSAPASATGVVICNPANGSTVGTSFTAVAKGGSAVTFMELWVDGTKRFQTSGNNISTAMSLPPGSHKMTVFGKNSSGVVGSAVSFFTVQ
jgi:hypothetical protein